MLSLMLECIYSIFSAYMDSSIIFRFSFKLDYLIGSLLFYSEVYKS